jgi:ABC-type uncharacterized transport system auxiliary subunit
MKHYMTKLLSLALSLAAISMLQACSPTASPQSQSRVAQAFETSGTVAVAPYTRTIFSSANF